MTRSKILFRTYGGKVKNKQTGLGHIFRCINLANELKKSFDIYFLVEDYGGSRKIIKNFGFQNIFTLPKNISVNLDIEKTTKFIEKNNIGLTIVDKHKISKKYIKKLNTITKTVVITDLYETGIPSDILVNGYIGLSNKKYRNSTNTLCLLGPKYQILNKNFATSNSKYSKQFDILVTFGALDEKNMAETFLNSLQDFVKIFKIKIIVGPIGTYSKTLKTFAKTFPDNITIIKKTDNMKKEILQSKFGFTAGGITSYEFASLKIPFAIICDSKHQLPTANEWEIKKMAINLGFINKKTNAKIHDLLKKINRSKIIFKKSTIDGKGIIRVCNEITKQME